MWKCVIKKSLFHCAAYPGEIHEKSHNIAHYSKCIQRNPRQFVVTRLTISCPNQNKTDEYIVKNHAEKEYVLSACFFRQHAYSAE